MRDFKSKPMTVKSIDVTAVYEDLKVCPKSVRDYVKALEGVLETQKKLTAKAIDKIRELSKTIEQ